jgi:glutamyl endopeptidase
MTLWTRSLRYAHLLGLAILLLGVILVLAPTQFASAQKPNRNKIVRNDGAVFEMKQMPGNMSPSFAGSGAEGILVNQKVEAKNLLPIRPQGTESVIGPDGRTQVLDTETYPGGAIAFLEVTFPLGSGTCSGFFIDVNRLATAAHCIYGSSLGGFATSITVHPGRNGGTAPFGSFPVVNGYVHQKWVDTEKPKFDFGVLVLGSDVGNTVGWFGYGYNTDNTFFDKRKTTVRGYPGDKTYGTMWTMNGKIQEVNKTRFFYKIDTFGGQSGSPHYGKWGTDCNPCAFGVHTYGVGGNWDMNSSTRITRKVYTFFGGAGLPIVVQ